VGGQRVLKCPSTSRTHSSRTLRFDRAPRLPQSARTSPRLFGEEDTLYQASMRFPPFQDPGSSTSFAFGHPQRLPAHGVQHQRGAVRLERFLNLHRGHPEPGEQKPSSSNISSCSILNSPAPTTPTSSASQPWGRGRRGLVGARAGHNRGEELDLDTFGGARTGTGGSARGSGPRVPGSMRSMGQAPLRDQTRLRGHDVEARATAPTTTSSG